MSTERNVASARALTFAAALPQLQEVARSHGYALAVHGSMRTDLDLVAVPWVQEAADPEELIGALQECVGGHIGTPVPREKPHGRKGWTIVWGHLMTKGLRTQMDTEGVQWPYLDISVMPRVP